MGRHTITRPRQVFVPVSLAGAIKRLGRRTFTLRAFAFSVASAVMFVCAIAPINYESALADAEAEPSAAPAMQELAVVGSISTPIVRDSYSITKPPPPPPPPPRPPASSAPAAGSPDPGTAKAIASGMVSARGWGAGEYNCLVALWNKESNWNVYAHNRSSGAYGIPQSLPGSKMASAGADWQTNPATQIKWGLGYIQNRYGSPCGAWNASQTKGWY